MNQSPQFVNQMAPNTLLYGIYMTVEKIISYALGEHDPGSAQDWRTLSDLWRCGGGGGGGGGGDDLLLHVPPGGALRGHLHRSHGQCVSHWLGQQM